MAITFVTGITNSSSASVTGTGAMGTGGMTVAPGDLVYLFTWNSSSTAQPFLAFTDNINSGTWTKLINQGDVPNARYAACAFIVCNASGSLTTVSYTGMAASSNNGFAILHFNGFLVSAAYAGIGSSDATMNFQTVSSSTAVAGISFNTSQNNELVIANVADLNGHDWATAPAAPWVTPTMGGSGQDIVEAHSYYQIFSTSGSAAQLTGTLSAADFWFVSQVGFYDFVAPPPVPVGWVA